jgi:hypothetical protein
MDFFGRAEFTTLSDSRRSYLKRHQSFAQLKLVSRISKVTNIVIDGHGQPVLTQVALVRPGAVKRSIDALISESIYHGSLLHALWPPTYSLLAPAMR